MALSLQDFYSLFCIARKSSLWVQKIHSSKMNPQGLDIEQFQEESQGHYV